MPAIDDIQAVEHYLNRDWTFAAVEVQNCKANWLVFYYEKDYSGSFVEISDSPEDLSWIVVSREEVEAFL